MGRRSKNSAPRPQPVRKIATTVSPSSGSAVGEGESSEVRFPDFQLRAGAPFSYVYNHSARWEHELRVEAVAEREKAVPREEAEGMIWSACQRDLDELPICLRALFSFKTRGNDGICATYIGHWPRHVGELWQRRADPALRESLVAAAFRASYQG